jgi:hypothetical protein
MNRILDALRSPGAMMIALMLALVAQGKHTADVFTYFSHAGTPVWLSYVFACAVEVAVLLFVLNKHKLISYVFAVATFATNMVYYAIGGVDMQSVALVPVVLLSALLPGVIVGYSHTIAENTIKGETQPATTQRGGWRFWRKPLEAAASLNHTAAAEQTRYGVPVGTLTAQNVKDAAADPLPESPNTPEPTTSPAPALRKTGKPNEYGMTDTQLAELLGVKRQAIAPMRERGTLTTRIARDLPQLEPVHTNGFNSNHSNQEQTK